MAFTLPEVTEFRKVTIHVVVYLVFYFGISKLAHGQNVALHKDYELSVEGNYSLTGNSSGSLTDGFSSNASRFWQLPTTTGWWYRNEVEIKIDLHREENIGEITFNTARGEGAEVYYPKHIFAFLSKNGRDYVYAGDLASSSQNGIGAYQVHKFSLKDIGLNARYVNLVVVAQGKYIFTDEIEVSRGEGAGRGITGENLIKKADLEIAVDSLNQLANKLRALRNSEVYKKLSSTPMSDPNKADPRNLESFIKRSRLDITLKQFDSPFIVERVNPWADVDVNALPQADKSVLEFDFTMAHRGVQYGGVLITNNTKGDLWLEIKVEYSGFPIRVFHAPRIASRNRAYLIDPFIPIAGDKVKVNFGSNEILVFEVIGEILGKSEAKLSIGSDQKEVNLRVATTTFQPKPSEVARLNVNTWAYLDYPTLRNRKEEAVADLNRHHNNVTVVHSKFIPRIGNNNFTKMKEYIFHFPTTNKVLLFTNFRNKARRDINSRVQFMSPQWKEQFTEWYGKMIRAVEEVGFPASQVYWYPYDEVKTEEVNDFIAFAKWAKKDVPQIQLYLTILDQQTFETIPYTDIAQLHMPLIYKSSIPEGKSELWAYEVIPDAREYPALEYKLMGWRAYYYGLKGAGFWNYADVGKQNENLITSIGSNFERDYAVVYVSTDGDIVTSRRWEAFKLGVEDFEIIMMYESQFGEVATKALVKEVLDGVENLDLADSVRKEMILKIISVETLP